MSSQNTLGAYDILFAPKNRVVTLKLIRYTLIMVLFPLSTFYFFQSMVFRNDKAKMAYSGLAAVVAVNVVIYSYVVMAWNEFDDEKKENPKTGKIENKADKKAELEETKKTS